MRFAPKKCRLVIEKETHMETVISKYEARYIMASVGRTQEFDELLYLVLPDLVEEWATTGLALSIEHCFVKKGNACLLRIDCIGADNVEQQLVLLNGDKKTLAVFAHQGRPSVVSLNQFKKHMSDVIVMSAKRMEQQVNALPQLA
jgi:hypothetical protein